MPGREMARDGLATTAETLMNDNNDSELKKALRDAEKRFRVVYEDYFKFMARARDASENNTIPASYIDEWCKKSDEFQEAQAAVNKIVDSILGSR